MRKKRVKKTSIKTKNSGRLSSLRKGEEKQRRQGKIVRLNTADSEDAEEYTRSLASIRRAREREREKLRQQPSQETSKITRNVVVPETITVQELSNRMSERNSEVIKALMKLGVYARINQTIDADTAELIATELGHRVQRVSESDIEQYLDVEEDTEEQCIPIPPVVTVMGHVNHGKTSLLDALRETDVVSKEMGSITQHIGAYQITLDNQQKITFIDTPGHEVFTGMRARGANVTNMVILVVAANDGIMPQTIEAIRHAKAAKVPMIIAINKMDLPDADSNHTCQSLLHHGVVVEKMGGDIQVVEISAKYRKGLDKVIEAILLEAELLDLKANPHRKAYGVVLESKMERGRGPVSTILLQKGTLHIGDCFVSGFEWGKVRALLNDKGQKIENAGPATPVEVIGCHGISIAGDPLIVVDKESQARDIAQFRQRKRREAKSAISITKNLQDMFRSEAAPKELALILKADVHGSQEALSTALQNMTKQHSDIVVRILHSAVGAVNETDIALAAASNAKIICFNVRATPQALELARRDQVTIKYYSIIYHAIDEVKTLLESMLTPLTREHLLGTAEVLQIFPIKNLGNIAGCTVIKGFIRHGEKLRILRNQRVIYEGKLQTLKRFKEDTLEVSQGYECGMAFENFEDIQVGDHVESFEIQEIIRTL